MFWAPHLRTIKGAYWKLRATIALLVGTVFLGIRYTTHQPSNHEISSYASYMYTVLVLFFAIRSGGPMEALCWLFKGNQHFRN